MPMTMRLPSSILHEFPLFGKYFCRVFGITCEFAGKTEDEVRK